MAVTDNQHLDNYWNGEVTARIEVLFWGQPILMGIHKPFYYEEKIIIGLFQGSFKTSCKFVILQEKEVILWA